MAKIQEFESKAGKNNEISGRTGSTSPTWSRQEKLGIIASFVMLGILAIFVACSKKESKPAVSAVANPAAPAVASTTSTTPTPAPTEAKKKTHRKRASIVTYSDASYGVSFRYPRKYELASGEKAQPAFAGVGVVPMNFVQPGGITVATVAMPTSLYPKTDFSSGFFNVNVNRSISEQECSSFAFVDTRNPDGEPVEPEQVEVGSMKMEKTADFSGSMMRQAEAQYYHLYDNGACYEFVLGLGTEGYGTVEGIQPVDRDEVFAKLEKILATVKIHPMDQEQVATKIVKESEQAAK